MTKSELVQRLAELNPHLYLRDVEKIVETFFDDITDALLNSSTDTKQHEEKHEEILENNTRDKVSSIF